MFFLTRTFTELARRILIEVIYVHVEDTWVKKPQLFGVCLLHGRSSPVSSCRHITSGSHLNEWWLFSHIIPVKLVANLGCVNNSLAEYLVLLKRIYFHVNDNIWIGIWTWSLFLVGINFFDLKLIVQTLNWLFQRISRSRVPYFGQSLLVLLIKSTFPDFTSWIIACET